MRPTHSLKSNQSGHQLNGSKWVDSVWFYGKYFRFVPLRTGQAAKVKFQNKNHAQKVDSWHLQPFRRTGGNVKSAKVLKCCARLSPFRLCNFGGLYLQRNVLVAAISLVKQSDKFIHCTAWLNPLTTPFSRHFLGQSLRLSLHFWQITKQPHHKEETKGKIQ